jgi:hypothetical protein
MNFVCKFCKNTIELNNDDINYIRGKKAGHLKSCRKFKEFKNDISKEYLIEEYVNKKRSASDISFGFGFSSSTFIINLLKKYGIILRKIKETNSSKHSKQKRINTNINIYGCENVRQSPIIKKIIKNNTNYEKLGKNVSKTLQTFSKEKWKEIRKKAIITMMERYGVPNAACFDHTRQKMRLTTIKNIQYKKNNGFPVYPNFNYKACEIIDEYGKQNNYNFLHALNGGEYFINELGYWVDGYDVNNNIVIEIDESYHFDEKDELREKDIKRQKEIEEFLKCKFIRLNFNDYNANTENKEG